MKNTANCIIHFINKIDKKEHISEYSPKTHKSSAKGEWLTISRSKSGGNFPRISVDRSCITSPADLPPLPDCLGSVNKILSNS